MAKSKPWENKWKIIDSLPGGGQCFNYKVKSLNAEDSNVYVLKVIKDENKFERRARFYREVHHYISLNSPYFPQIKDHNCINISSSEGKLYFVYDYIEGKNLEEYINENGRLPLDVAIRFIFLLIDALRYSHENDIVHRDIKPDNIVLCEGIIDMPKLIDFGLSAAADDEVLPESGDHQLGNRFLYLPELKYGSGNKRDKRSDITYLVGIFLYILTGEIPAQFIDDQGRYPHQRINLKDHIPDATSNQLLLLQRCFDIGFQHQINNRFQSLDHLTEYLIKINLAEVKEEFDFEEFLKSSANKVMLKLEQKLQQIESGFRSMFNKVANEITIKFQDIEVGRSGPSVLAHWDPMCVAGHFYLTEKFERNIQKSYLIKIYPNGNEFLLSTFIDEKNEVVIDRFENFSKIDQETSVKMIYTTIMRDFALYKRVQA